ncbi:hypothetical protein [Pseudomonas sp. BGI-2]|uniref:hypothetical protein n=1 Tax=Pseudomonas sp. BGI-2 TaxID=2528211 RepID=UPI0010352FE2|nr:hypothetical protein [Pseudomonas sp. BGI-2]TBN46937.1 hypothetical protein EYC95_11515 [Pseudomonas sp. BGI-2]
MLASFRMAATIAGFAGDRENTQIPVGAKLAREDGVSAAIYVEYGTVFASKLRSYRFMLRPPNPKQKKARSR